MTAHTEHKIFGISTKNAVFGLIIILTLASISNIFEAAQKFHGGFFVAGCIAIAFAFGFALCVIVVMTAQTDKTKSYAIFCAVVFGLISGSMQTFVYVEHGAGLFIAVCFGFCVPAMEGGLAALEAMLSADSRSLRSIEIYDADYVESIKAQLEKFQTELEKGQHANLEMSEALQDQVRKCNDLEVQLGIADAEQKRLQDRLHQKQVQPAPSVVQKVVSEVVSNVVQVQAPVECTPKVEIVQDVVQPTKLEAATRRLHVLRELSQSTADVAMSEIAEKINQAFGTSISRQYANNDKNWLIKKGWINMTDNAWTVTPTGQQQLQGA